MSTDYGIKVSLPGFDAETAGDQDLYFNSSWPLLKIDESLSGTMTLAGNTAIDIVTHNLGYPPFVMIFSEANGFYPYYISSINSNTVVINGTAGDVIQYYVFRNPLNINFQAPNIQLATTQQGTNNEDWGIKFSKPGKDVSSTDLRDFTIHSGTKSLQVHQVIYQPLGTVTVAGGTTFSPAMEYMTDLPYDPVYFAFYSSDNQNFIPLFAAAQSAPKIDYDSITGGIIINDSGGTGGWGVFYILLDPYQSTTNIEVTL